ncbi:hypothetical protein EDC04DRAFT_2604483 [Pisolithus marmoratus]|nr:hypothetical protein EDC04DRAFT_2604483 [Pisolithus marmoratus]
MISPDYEIDPVHANLNLMLAGLVIVLPRKLHNETGIVWLLRLQDVARWGCVTSLHVPKAWSEPTMLITTRVEDRNGGRLLSVRRSLENQATPRYKQDREQGRLVTPRWKDNWCICAAAGMVSLDFASDALGISHNTRQQWGVSFELVGNGLPGNFYATRAYYIQEHATQGLKGEGRGVDRQPNKSNKHLSSIEEEARMKAQWTADSSDAAQWSRPKQ